jgi:hypothetical protein
VYIYTRSNEIDDPSAARRKIFESGSWSSGYKKMFRSRMQAVFTNTDMGFVYSYSQCSQQCSGP